MSKDYLDLLDDLALQMDKLKSYVGRVEEMVGAGIETLHKKHPHAGGDMFVDGYRGFTKEDFNFLAWLMVDIQEIVDTVSIKVTGLDSALRENSSLVCPPWIPVIQEGKPANPAMLSGLTTRLSSILTEHGDMVVLVEGNDLTKVEPTIWNAEDHVVTGEELRNCVFLS